MDICICYVNNTIYTLTIHLYTCMCTQKTICLSICPCMPYYMGNLHIRLYNHRCPTNQNEHGTIVHQRGPLKAWAISFSGLSSSQRWRTMSALKLCQWNIATAGYEIKSRSLAMSCHLWEIRWNQTTNSSLLGSWCAILCWQQFLQAPVRQHRRTAALGRKTSRRCKASDLHVFVVLRIGEPVLSLLITHRCTCHHVSILPSTVSIIQSWTNPWCKPM